MPRTTTIALLGLGAVAVVVAASRHATHGMGHAVTGGVIMGDASRYDAMTGLVLGSFYDGIAADVASTLPADARVLDVGCGPGHLAMRLARLGGLDVTGVDLDPEMVERAAAHAAADDAGPAGRATFLAADVASLPFPDASFDAVVSTMSMHHWADVHAGLGEIARVVRPGGRVLVWDLKPGIVPLHAHAPDPSRSVEAGPLRVVADEPWRWPWRLPLTRRLELAAPSAV